MTFKDGQRIKLAAFCPDCKDGVGGCKAESPHYDVQNEETATVLNRDEGDEEYLDGEVLTVKVDKPHHEHDDCLRECTLDQVKEVL